MPSEAVLRLMKKELDGGVPVFHFTNAGVRHILDALPAGATHGVGGDHDTLRFNGREVSVRMDDDGIPEQYLNENEVPKADTPDDVLSRYVIIEAEDVADDVERQDVERVLLDAMAEGPQPPPAAEGAGKRRKGKKTRKTKGGKKRKTLRRKK